MKRLSIKIYTILYQWKEDLNEYTHHYTNKKTDQPNTYIDMATYIWDTLAHQRKISE